MKKESYRKINISSYLMGLSFVLIAVFFTAFMPVSVEKIMMTMKSQSLHKGKVVNVDAELYYNQLSGSLITRYIQPAGQILKTNEKGELSIYNEEANTVTYRQGAEYSTESNMVLFFLQGKIQDLGLSDFGFQLMSTRFEEEMVITEWFPPAELYHLFNRIELVHKDFVPIYIAYYDAQRNLAKKVFYSQYEYLDDVSFPTLVTEFNYIGKDSIINRIRFSDIKVNHQAVSSWFDFTIPEDAQLKQ
jgi:outer membrane lipoprotein-sorting protein